MEINPSGNDPKSIWQNQSAETSKVTILLIRQRARNLHAATRRELVASAILHLIAFGCCVAGVALGHGPWVRIGFAVGIVYTLAGAMIVQRGMWTGPMPGDAGFSNGIEFCRKELARNGAIFSRMLLWVVGPVLFPVAAYLGAAIGAALHANPKAGPKVLMNLMPFLVLMALWFVGFFFLRMRQRKGLQREIDDLNEVEKANR